MKPRFFLTLTLVFAIFLGSCALFRPADPAGYETTVPGTQPVQDTGDNSSDTSVFRDTETDTETAAPEIQETVVSFVGAGDNIVYYGNVRDAASCALPGGRSYNFAPIYKDVAERIATADISFINQETLMCGEGYKFSYYPMFNGPQDMGYDLAELGFDVVNIANNHMLDKGAAGLKATIDFWNTFEEVTLIGGYLNEEDYNTVRVVEASGIRVAFLSYAFYANGLTLPASSELIFPYPDEETVARQIKKAQEEADFVIVSAHWGDENTFTPNDEQRQWAEYFAECGADAVIGHHPHVIQPIEWITRPDGKKMLCVYSLGNFVAEMARDYNMLGGLISFDIIRRGNEVTAENVVFTPTVYYFTTSFYRNHVYLLTDFTKKMALSHGLAYYGRSLSIDTLMKYLHNTIDDSFLPAGLRRADHAE